VGGGGKSLVLPRGFVVFEGGEMGTRKDGTRWLTCVPCFPRTLPPACLPLPHLCLARHMSRQHVCGDGLCGKGIVRIMHIAQESEEGVEH